MNATPDLAQVFCDAHVFPNKDGSARIFVVGGPNVHEGAGFMCLDVQVGGTEYPENMLNASVVAQELLVSYQIAKYDTWQDARVYNHKEDGTVTSHGIYYGHVLDFCKRNAR